MNTGRVGAGLLASLLTLMSSVSSAGEPTRPHLSLRSYPALVAIPGYPVYYAPDLNANYFFHQGWYWVFDRDHWYRASWYNGPWLPVAPGLIPAFILRVPVAYYSQAPSWFSGWSRDAPPRWNERWGEAWTRRRSGWEQWNRASVRAIAPLPSYQKNYSGPDYPQSKQQRELQIRNYPTLPESLLTRR